MRADTQSELAMLLREPPPNTPQAGGAIASAAIVSQQRTASTTFVAAIENLRAVPIEAYGFQVLDAATGRLRSGQSTDFCVVLEPDSAPSAVRRIQPHEIREIPLGVRVDPDAPLPPVRLSFVIFDDLVSEGDPAARDQTFRERESRAADFAFALATLSQAAARPVTEIYSFLVAKRVERAKELQASGRPENSMASMAIDELIRQAKESPTRMLANAPAMTEYFERVRARLVRHVGR
jgi:hypothetical protein